jgi:DNA polymerase III delta subunit
MATRAPKPPFDASCRILILHGKEAFLRSEYTRMLREMLEEARGEVQTIRFDGASGSLAPADVLDELRSPGLMPVCKLVIVEEAEQFIREATRPMFERYAAAPSEHGALVLRSETWRAGMLD